MSIDRELAFAGPREAQFRRVYAFPWFKRPLLSRDVYRLRGSWQGGPRRGEVSDPHEKPSWPVTLRNATKYAASDAILPACSSTTESIVVSTVDSSPALPKRTERRLTRFKWKSSYMATCAQ